VRVIAEITLRQLVSRRRILLLLVLALVPVLVALAFRLADPLDVDAQEWTGGLLDNLGISVLLPVVALLIGTAALGAEIEDGTAVYILARPIPRWQIIVTKLAVATAVTAVVTCTSAAIAGTLALRGEEGDGLVAGTVIGLAFGALIYSALFLLLSLVTRRALIYGLFYVLIWEGMLAGLFAGTRIFSVKQYALGVADAVAGVPADVLDAPLEVSSALPVGLAVAVGAVVLAVRRLQGFNLLGDAAS
jgi:ABC-2 type transport system permease protein